MPPAWPPHLQDALRGALVYAVGHTQETIERALVEGKMQLWDAPHSFCLTELYTAPNGMKAVNLFLAGGHLAELHPIFPYIEGWARDNGATKIQCVGRRGWERSFLTKDEGFRPTMTYYEKDVPNG